MIYSFSFISIVEVLVVTVPVLLTVAFVTVAERKTMASMQRRLGPNVIGYYGLLQAFADALKLILKEYISPTQANIILFFVGPVITLVFSLLGYAVIPYGSGLAIWDFNLGILYMLAVSSLATYGILLAGWSANSKYAFLGSLRSTAQLISYELILSSAILLVLLLTGSLNLTVNTETQKAIWLIFPLLPVFIIFFIGSVAETNRAPFDLAEAESELVSGFMTEHAAVIFVFFFLAEYASIVLICILNAMLFFGGYLFYYAHVIREITFNLPSIEGIISGLTMGLKSCIMIFVFIWVRASFPRIRFDQLMSFSWTILLPIVIALIVLAPCMVYNFEIIPSNVNCLGLFLIFKKPRSFFINIFLKAAYLFIVGLSIRYLIFTYGGVNVFYEFTHWISYLYYLFMSFFSVLTNETFNPRVIASCLQTINQRVIALCEHNINLRNIILCLQNIKLRDIILDIKNSFNKNDSHLLGMGSGYGDKPEQAGSNSVPNKLVLHMQNNTSDGSSSTNTSGGDSSTNTGVASSSTNTSDANDSTEVQTNPKHKIDFLLNEEVRKPLKVSAEILAAAPVLDSTSFHNLGVSLERRAEYIADRKGASRSGNIHVTARELGFDKESTEHRMIVDSLAHYRFKDLRHNPYHNLQTKNWRDTVLFIRGDNNQHLGKSSFGGGPWLLRHIRDFNPNR